jgi:hypothetical protein
MAKKHKVKISKVKGDTELAPEYKVKCSACDCSMTGFGGPGPAETAAERYHSARGTKIDEIKS